MMEKNFQRQGLISMLLVCVLTLCISVSNASEESKQAQAQQIAEKALESQYLFEKVLYDCSVTTQSDESWIFEYRWRDSTAVIFAVTVFPDSTCRVDYYDTYSLENYYDELRTLYGGLFSHWSIEKKAWFSEVLPALWQLEEFRVPHFNAQWIAQSPPFVPIILAHRHGIPDSRTIPQETALNNAKQWLVANEKMDVDVLDMCQVSTYYYVDDPKTPQWMFQFEHKPVIINIWMNAYTGDIYYMTQQQVLELAKEWLMTHEPYYEASQLQDDLFTIYCMEGNHLNFHLKTSYAMEYDAKSPVWIIRFDVSPYGFYEIVIEDQNQSIVTVKTCNG